MTIWNPRRSRSFALLSSLAGLSGALGTACAIAAPGGLLLAAAPAVESAPGQAGAQELYLEVSLNKVNIGKLARFYAQPGGGLWASADTLRDLGLRWPGRADTQGLVALDTLPGLVVTYDASNQRVALQAPVDMLDRPVAHIGAVDTDIPRVDPGAQLPGLVLNYDLYGQHTGGAGNSSTSLSGWNELRVMGMGPGVWSNTMVSRWQSGPTVNTQQSTVWLDTQWQRNFQDSMVSLTVGDAVTGALSWSRPTRIGGVRLARNFALQPYRTTAPLAMVQGEAVLPSTVDLYINGLRQSSQQVQPGQFALNGVPSLNGLGQAQMVITDINGQQRTVDFALYGTPQLLQAGLADWSLDLGAVRRDYGIRSFAYDNQPMASATGRYGWSDRTTLEAHAEAGADVQQAGVGGVWRLGQQAGVVNAAVAASQNAGQAGQQGSVGYQWSGRRLNVVANSLRRDRNYRDVASLHGATLPRGSDQIFLGASTDWGSFGLGLVRQQYTNNAPTRFANLSWSRQLPHNASLNVSAIRNLDDGKGTSVYLSLSMPLDRYLSTSASVRHSRDATSATIGATRSVPSDLGGWGWRAEAGVGDSRSAQAQVSQLGRYGQWAAGVAYVPGTQGASSSTTSYASANGGLLWAQGQAYAMRQVDDAFAVVSTSGVPGVPVQLENRAIGVTDEHGFLLVNRLNAYQRNRLSIDPLQLPADMHISRVGLEAVPEARSGVLARFDMRRILAVQASVVDGQGQHLPPGSRIWLESAQTAPWPLVVGYDGLVYLEDPPSGAVLRADTPSGSCRAFLPGGKQQSGLVDLGVLTCR